MKDLIKKILDADEETKNNDTNVERLKIESSNRIAYILNERREEYIDKARMNIKVIKKIEDSKASMEIDKIRSNCNSLLDQVNNEYNNHKQEWVNQIFNNIININSSILNLKKSNINEKQND